MSLFSTLYTSYSGLKTSQIATEVIGHNIANAENEHYTRQRAEITTRHPWEMPDGVIGTGADVAQIVRLHDEFVYTKFRKSQGDLTHKQFMEKVLVEVAKHFPDISKKGLAKELSSFFEGWQKLASNPADDPQKIVLAENTVQLSTNMRNIYKKLDDTQKNLDDQLKSAVEEVNKIVSKIAALNHEIKATEVHKYNRANDLRDQRDKLETALTELIDPVITKTGTQTMTDVDKNIADYNENYSIMLGGYQLVSDKDYQTIHLDKGKNSIRGFSNLFVKHADYTLTDISQDVSGGKIGAILKLRGKVFNKHSGEVEDGLLQKFKNELDTFARGLMQSVNTVYAGSATNIMESDKIGNTIAIDVDQARLPMIDLHPEKLKHKVIKGDMVFSIYDKGGNEKRQINIELDPEHQSFNTIVDVINARFKSEGIDAKAKIELGTLSIESTKDTTAILLRRDDTLITQALDITGFRDLDLVNKIDVPFDIKDGSFKLNVYNENGQTLASRKIIIDKTSENPMYSTLEGIALQINMAYKDDNKDKDHTNDVDDFVKASFGNNTFKLRIKDSNAKLEFNITDDTTGFSGAVGLHKFFQGTSAKTIDLLSDFKNRSSNINAYGRSVKGDNEVANKMQQLQYEKVDFLSKDGSHTQETIMGQYRYVAGIIASDTHDMQVQVETAKALNASIKAQQKAISGVNIDEELVGLIKYQAGYSANARVISTIQTMLDTLLSIKN